MFREHIFPVASPDLLKRFGMPREPAELLRYPLLAREGSDLVPKWEVWFQNIGLGVTSLKESVRFPDTNMTVEAALLGQGIALVRSGHVEKELRDGSLVRLFDVPFPSPVAYYFVCPKGIETQAHVASFRDWLIGESTAAGTDYH
jgi:LysR family glycine cleavage system transcriptional activator